MARRCQGPQRPGPQPEAATAGVMERSLTQRRKGAKKQERLSNDSRVGRRCWPTDPTSVFLGDLGETYQTYRLTTVTRRSSEWRTRTVLWNEDFPSAPGT